MNAGTAANAVRGWEGSGRPEGISTSNVPLMTGGFLGDGMVYGAGGVSTIDYSKNPNKPVFDTGAVTSAAITGGLGAGSANDVIMGNASNWYTQDWANYANRPENAGK